MRIIKTLKNSIYGIISYILLAVLGLLIRKAFLQTLPVEILGYEGLFGNVFSIISLADLGMESVIMYRLFPAFAKEDTQEINKIMAVYKYLYRMVGLIILGIGILLLPFLRLLIAEGDYNWSFVYTIYIIQLMMTLTSYFLAYKRIMFRVNQNEYECIKIDTAGAFAFGLLRLGILLLLKSYYLYLLCSLIGNIITNYIISRKANQTFEYYNAKRKVTWQDIRDMRIGSEIKNNVVQKICGVIYGGTDSIIITATQGIANVGLLANYNMFLAIVQTIFDKLMNPLQMSIGNFVYSENQENRLRMFRMFDFVSFFLACIITSCFNTLLNPAISFFFGKEYLLSQGFVVAFCINQYINWNHHLVCFYRGVLGHYELDKVPIMLAAILNIVVSLALSKPMGMSGIMLGTAIGHLGFWFGRVRVVYTVYIHEALKRYIFRQTIRLFCCTVEVLLAFYLCRGIPISLFGIIIRLLVACFLPCIMNGALFWKTDEMKCTIDYLKKIRRIIDEKRKQLISMGEKTE
ncbi:MAG: hypothetical protein IKF90_17580 [Parasporobacterium sp.]|nr:hypothetical protein [Parasporobacterium sp.]